MEKLEKLLLAVKEARKRANGADKKVEKYSWLQVRDGYAQIAAAAFHTLRIDHSELWEEVLSVAKTGTAANGANHRANALDAAVELLKSGKAEISFPKADDQQKDTQLQSGSEEGGSPSTTTRRIPNASVNCRRAREKCGLSGILFLRPTHLGGRYYKCWN